MVELKNVFYLKINNVGIDKMSILTSINVSCRSIYSMELSFVFHTTDVIKRFFLIIFLNCIIPILHQKTKRKFVCHNRLKKYLIFMNLLHDY